MKLSSAQSKALEKFQDGEWKTAYDTQSRITTLDALSDKGLLERECRLGYIFSPRTSIFYRLKKS
jgi:hypothetical protein